MYAYMRTTHVQTYTIHTCTLHMRGRTPFTHAHYTCADVHRSLMHTTHVQTCTIHTCMHTHVQTYTVHTCALHMRGRTPFTHAHYTCTDVHHSHMRTTHARTYTVHTCALHMYSRTPFTHVCIHMRTTHVQTYTVHTCALHMRGHTPFTHAHYTCTDVHCSHMHTTSILTENPTGPVGPGLPCTVEKHQSKYVSTSLASFPL